jgi:hypothetical protein
MNDLSPFREQAEAVVAEHGESEGTVNKRAFCAHEECSMYCPCDAYTQATRVIELVKMVEGIRFITALARALEERNSDD